jgi:hypothetical protein
MGFIFLRVPKTASSSISRQLCNKINFCENDAYSEFANYPSLNVKKLEDQKGEHATLSQFLKSNIINDEDISSLKIYGVLRNPIERTLSMFSHVLKNFENIDISTYTKNDVIDKGLKLFYGSPLKYIYSKSFQSPEKITQVYPLFPQTNWLVYENKPISNILLYPNFSDFLEMYTGNPKLNFNLKIGKKYDENQKVNSSYISELRKLYFEDFQMWERRNYASVLSY